MPDVIAYRVRTVSIELPLLFLLKPHLGDWTALRHCRGIAATVSAVLIRAPRGHCFTLPRRAQAAQSGALKVITLVAVAFAHAVQASSKQMMYKGIVTAGPLKSVLYALHKVKKRIFK